MIYTNDCWDDPQINSFPWELPMRTVILAVPMPVKSLWLEINSCELLAHGKLPTVLQEIEHIVCSQLLMNLRSNKEITIVI